MCICIYLHIYLVVDFSLFSLLFSLVSLLWVCEMKNGKDGGGKEEDTHTHTGPRHWCFVCVCVNFSLSSLSPPASLYSVCVCVCLFDYAYSEASPTGELKNKIHTLSLSHIHMYEHLSL